MSESTQKLAEQIALLLENNSNANDFNFVQNEIAKINSRLENIENNLISQTPESKIPNSAHPSQNKFAEIFADEIIENFTNEKACPYEPTGKPCDNCSMCSSLGY